MNRSEQFDDIKMSISEGQGMTQYTYPDHRIYEDHESGVMLASVTTVLEEIKNDKFLEMFKEKNGTEAVNQLLKKASASGTHVHESIDRLCMARMAGEDLELYLLNEYGKLEYSEDEWKGVMRFVDFYDNYVDEIILTESRLKSIDLRVGGTVDAIFKLKDGRTVLVDHKFANQLTPKYSIQTWIYTKMFQDTYGIKLDGRCNLWLKANTRGHDKTGKKIQGNGYQLVFHEEDEVDELLFMAAHTIFFQHRWKGKELKPLHRVYPTTLKLSV